MRSLRRRRHARVGRSGGQPAPGAARATELACILGACTLALPVVYSTARDAIRATWVDVATEVACLTHSGTQCHLGTDASTTTRPHAAAQIVVPAPVDAKPPALQRTTSGDLAFSSNRDSLSYQERAIQQTLPTGHLLALRRDLRVEGPIVFQPGDPAAGIPYGYYLRVDDAASSERTLQANVPPNEPFLLIDSDGNKLSTPARTYQSKTGARYLRLEHNGRALVSRPRQHALKEEAVGRLPSDVAQAVRVILGDRPLNPRLRGEVPDYQLATAITWQFLRAQGAPAVEATALAERIMRSVFWVDAFTHQGTAFISAEGVGYTNDHVAEGVTVLDAGNWFGANRFQVMSRRTGEKRVGNDVATLKATGPVDGGLPAASGIWMDKPVPGEPTLTLGFPVMNEGKGVVASTGVADEQDPTTANVGTLRFPAGRYLGNSGGPMFAWRGAQGLVMTGMVAQANERGSMWGPTGRRMDQLLPKHLKATERGTEHAPARQSPLGP